MRSLAFATVLALAATSVSACAARPRPANANQAAAANPNATLSSASTIACATDGDCAVCYRASSCGEPIAANDPNLEAPACHVTPAAFCMPRRGRCEERHCIAR